MVWDDTAGSNDLVSFTSPWSLAIKSGSLQAGPVILASELRKRASRTAVTPLLNCSVLATKSVSQAIYTIVTFLAAPWLSSLTAIRPSAATLSIFFSAWARPFFLRISLLASRSPPVSFRAAMQSLSGDPVISLSYFTRAGVATEKERAGQLTRGSMKEDCAPDGTIACNLGTEFGWMRPWYFLRVVLRA